MNAKSNETSSNLKDKIKYILANKLTSSQIEEGFLYIKELCYVLGCTERTLARWRQLREKGNKTVGIPSYLVLGKYRYLLDDIYQYFIDNMI